jgi:hypothetical protein
MQAEWGYPTFGFCICDCPSAGHDMIMLDYRAVGPEGEPAVVHVDQEREYKVTALSPDFDTFVRGLVHESQYDTREADLADALAKIASSSLSSALRRTLAASPATSELEPILRRLLHATATEKGCFALHADDQSYLVYDLLFDLFVQSHAIADPEAFLQAYPSLIVIGDGDESTGGYAPAFLEDWMRGRLSRGEIVEVAGRLKLSDEHRGRLLSGLARFR